MSKTKQNLKSYLEPITTRQIVNVAFLMAMEIILTRFISIQTPIIRIGFGFIPIAIICIFYGPITGGIASALCDILGMLIFPKGAYFFGFTISSLIGGVIYGLILYRKKVNILTLSIAVILVTLIVDIGLNSYWLYLTTKTGSFALLIPRIIKDGIMAPIKVVCIFTVYKCVKLYFKKGLSFSAR